jgi:transcriptional regulator with XRE-family HTH domain
MFDMDKVAGKIKEARLTKNMTQMQLADEMGVSYQAVSNWERGNSMPDISKLGELSKVLDISIDTLLGISQKTDVVKKIMNGEEGELHLTMSELQEVIPIVSPQKTIDILGDILMQTDSLKLSDIVGVAPFVEESYLASLISKLTSEDNIHDVIGLAPFLSEESLIALMSKFTGMYQLSELVGLAPFLETSFLDELVGKALKEGNDSDCIGLYPFLSEHGLKALAEEMVRKGDFEALASIAPFL